MGDFELLKAACCARCRHRRDVFLPCDWLEEQQVLVLCCPHFEPMKEDEKDGQQTGQGCSL